MAGSGPPSPGSTRRRRDGMRSWWRPAVARLARHGREGGGRLRLDVEARGGGSSAGGGWMRLVSGQRMTAARRGRPVAEEAGARRRRAAQLARSSGGAPAHSLGLAARASPWRGGSSRPRWQLGMVAGQPGCCHGGQVRRGDRTSGAPAGGAGPEQQHHRRLDSSAKEAGGGGSSSSLPVGTLGLHGAPPLLCGEFLSWIDAATRQWGKLRLPKQCHLVPGSPSAKSGEAASGWWNGGVLGQLSGVVVR
ncbi:hypothetical protein OsI_36491 [Oryza sativa Indica Group]|uniref:Uncharacterized protein n=1 Tax=Oryza sativa subsp. indica TaxID=39946 RepID=A2ZFD2_ORYSI|nr:hypothetical protein OsI_36491 [Oryza sativa Indica Group]